MKLSMWTLHDWLEKRGAAPIAQITDGRPLICGVKSCIPQEPQEPEEDWASISPLENGGAVLLYKEDRILTPCTDAAVVHNHALEAFRYYNDWEKELLLCMLDGTSLQNLLGAAHRVFQRPMFIKSDSSWVYAITKGYEPNIHPDWSRMQDSVTSRSTDFNAVSKVSLDPEYQVSFTQTYPTIRKSPYYGDDVMHANVWLNGRRVCEIVALSHDRPFNPGDPHLMNFFVQMVHRVIQADSPLYLSHSGLSAFFADLLETENFDVLNTNAAIYTLGWSENDELAVICIAIQANYETPLLSVLREKLAEKFEYGCVFPYQSRVVCITNVTKAGGSGQIISRLEEIVPSEPFTWGVSYEFRGLQNFPAYYRQANLVLALAQSKKRSYMTMRQAAPEVMRVQIEKIPDFVTYLHPDVRRLREIDRKGGSRYADTLFQYLVCGGNFTDAAHKLRLHRNTLIYRMDRIREAINSDLDDMLDREFLLLSFLFEGTDVY